MSLLIASVHGHVPEQLDGADLLEIRIDAMDIANAIEQIPALLASSPIPTIVTCRSVAEGGMFKGQEEDRISMYRVALDCDNPPRYIDIEYEVLTRYPLMLDALSSEHTGIILSWHDTVNRPRNLMQRAAAMQDVNGIDVVKMVWRARSIRDNLEVFQLLQSRQQPMIAMCMGEYGLMSRILAPKFGGFAVYAAVDGYEKTADGQATVKELRSLYRFNELNSDTLVYGVIGNNVEHSGSPTFHNAAFEVADKNAVYMPLLVPDGWEHLKATVLELCNAPSLHFSGASVTIPHKNNMFKLVDDADSNCKKSGATNTVTFKLGASFGNNTDIEALASLVPHAKRVVILGSGGVARAAIVAMQSVGASVFIAARNTEQVELLTSTFSCYVATNDLKHIDTLINCTPVGMEGGNCEDGDPANTLVSELDLIPSMTVIDTVYKPTETRLIRRASEAGCKTITGDVMFRLQAVAQQKLWD
jgi:3-dehydroquinate dehydratase/shikimate dehydrogenase